MMLSKVLLMLGVVVVGVGSGVAAASPALVADNADDSVDEFDSRAVKKWTVDGGEHNDVFTDMSDKRFGSTFALKNRMKTVKSRVPPKRFGGAFALRNRMKVVNKAQLIERQKMAQILAFLRQLRQQRLQKQQQLRQQQQEQQQEGLIE